MSVPVLRALHAGTVQECVAARPLAFCLPPSLVAGAVLLSPLLYPPNRPLSSARRSRNAFSIHAVFIAGLYSLIPPCYPPLRCLFLPQTTGFGAESDPLFSRSGQDSADNLPMPRLPGPRGDSFLIHGVCNHGEGHPALSPAAWFPA